MNWRSKEFKEGIPDEYKPFAQFEYGKCKWFPHGVVWHWWRSPSHPMYCEYMYYFYWWNPLEKKYRYWGKYDMYYDGIHKTFGFWFFNISWSTKWSKMEGW
jgi:hypothetical protein